MSYEGTTSRNSKYVHLYTGNTTVVYPNMTTSHRSFSGPYIVYRNTFNTCFIRLNMDATYTTTGASSNLQRSLTDTDLLANRSMWYTNGTLSQKWYPPVSKGIASCDFTSIDNFSYTTSATATSKLEWEI